MVQLTVMRKQNRRRLQRPWTRFHLAEWCDHYGISQAELARRTRLSESLISQLFAGEANGGPESLERIAATLGIPLGWLFDVMPRKGHRWVLYSVPAEHLETFHLIVSRGLGVETGAIEPET